MASGYFCNAPVLKMTTSSSGLIQFLVRRDSKAPTQAADSGQRLIPSRLTVRCSHSLRRDSSTSIARPPLCAHGVENHEIAHGGGDSDAAGDGGGVFEGLGVLFAGVKGTNDRCAAGGLHAHHTGHFFGFEPAHFAEFVEAPSTCR